MNELTRAEREGRTHRGKVAPAAGEDPAVPATAEANGQVSEEEEEDSEAEGTPLYCFKGTTCPEEIVSHPSS